MAGFEPTAPCAQGTCSSRLSYIPVTGGEKWNWTTAIPGLHPGALPAWAISPLIFLGRRIGFEPMVSGATILRFILLSYLRHEFWTHLICQFWTDFFHLIRHKLFGFTNQCRDHFFALDKIFVTASKPLLLLRSEWIERSKLERSLVYSQPSSPPAQTPHFMVVLPGFEPGISRL